MLVIVIFREKLFEFLFQFQSIFSHWDSSTPYYKYWFKSWIDHRLAVMCGNNPVCIVCNGIWKIQVLNTHKKMYSKIKCRFYRFFEKSKFLLSNAIYNRTFSLQSIQEQGILEMVKFFVLFCFHMHQTERKPSRKTSNTKSFCI